MEPISLLLPSGTSPPVFSSTTIGWFGFLCITPIILTPLIRRALKISQEDALLAAYNLTALTPNLCLAAVGSYAWLVEDLSALSSTRHDRIYGYHPSAAMLYSVCIAYEAWNTAASLVIREYRTLAFIGHHATTLYLAILGTAPIVHYYTCFFLGLTSISSVFLSLSDVFRHSVTLQKRLPTTALALRISFAITFLVVRTCMWPLISAQFWLDAIGILQDGLAHSRIALCVYLIANVFLTCLQMLWTSKIINGVVSTVRGRGGDGANAKAARD